MEQREHNLEPIRIQWEPDDTYQFVGTLLTRDGKKELKSVWRGYFINRAPKGLEPGVEYCLKVITVHSVEKKLPQKREYYDAVAFHGPHQRRILARNTNAVQVEDELRTGKLQNRDRFCYVVEPVYERATRLFENCWRYPAALRLDVIGQYAQGCLELRSQENRLHAGLVVDAHRDIKIDNGMVEMLDKEIRIRLIDYASIHLERETAPTGVQTVRNTDGTYGGFLSPSNTAPEDLRYTDWQVGDTTDVYALGMMLASLFVHTEGEYINFNRKWIGSIPEDGDKAADKDYKTSQEFQRCQKAYDQTEGTTAWIEKALVDRGMAFCWEELPDPKVLKEIRQLFIKATRIDPLERISLEDFIKKIYEIREMAAACKNRIPVSLYLFEQTDFDQYGNAYAQEAANIFRQEGGRTRGLCVRYHHLIYQNSKPEEAIECQKIPCRNDQDLFDFAARIKRSNGRREDITALALYQAGKQLEAMSWAYRFSGNVYLFCREVPRDREMMGRIALLEKTCGRLGQRWGTRVNIDAFVIQERENSMEEEAWCAITLIRLAGPEKPGPDPDPGERIDPNMRPYGELYVTLPDGSIFWL